MRTRRPSYPIETERLLLRPFHKGDFEGLFAIQSRPDVARYLYGEPSDTEETRRSLEEKIGNSAIEAAVDLASPQRHPLAKVAKDLAAATVLIAAFASVVVGLLVLGPPLLRRLGW